jgi:hypothetical protein
MNYDVNNCICLENIEIKLPSSDVDTPWPSPNTIGSPPFIIASDGSISPGNSPSVNAPLKSSNDPSSTLGSSKVAQQQSSESSVLDPPTTNPNTPSKIISIQMPKKNSIQLIDIPESSSASPPSVSRIETSYNGVKTVDTYKTQLVVYGIAGCLGGLGLLIFGVMVISLRRQRAIVDEMAQSTTTMGDMEKNQDVKVRDSEMGTYGINGNIV